MFTQFPVKNPAFLRLRWASVMCWAVLVGRACAAPPVPFIGPDPADPYVQVPPIRYQSVTAPYVRLRPAEPTGWVGQNQSAAPTAHH
jgi:hypothetical protein